MGGMMMNEKKEYIERGTLIDSFDNCYYLYNSAVRETVRQALENAPVADVAPVVHGEWVYDHWCEFKCSNCGTWSNSKPYKGKENFCPNCGAKMDGGNENDKT